MGLGDEYTTPMFNMAWGQAFVVFLTATKGTNGTDSVLSSIAPKEEMNHAVDKPALAINMSISGFQLVICVEGLCGNDTSCDAYVQAMHNFILLRSCRLIVDRRVQCVQSLLRPGMDGVELLGVTWVHISRALT